MSAFQAKNVTVRAYAEQHALIERAAKKAGKTLSDWGRDILTERAAKELGVPIPKLPEMKRGRTNELAERAAKLVNLSPEEFMRQATERLALSMLGYDGPNGPPKPPTQGGDRATPVPRRRKQA